MNAGDALHADILASPDDDGIRLIYADWLTDSGDPDRAEFIRVQIELAQLRKGRISQRERDLREREESLLQQYFSAWFGDANDWPFFMAHPARGFIDAITVKGCQFAPLNYLWLFSLHPVREVIVSDWGGYEQQISSTVPLQLERLRLDDSCALTRSEVHAIDSFSHKVGWENTLQHLIIERAGFEGFEALKARLSKVTLHCEGLAFGPVGENGERLVFSSKYTSAPQMAEPQGGTP